MRKLFWGAVAALAALASGAPAQTLWPTASAPGISSPTPGTTFSKAVANLPVVADYVFGSSAAAPTDCASGGTCVAINNATNLAAYFNPYSDVSSIGGVPVKINSELEQYCVPIASCSSNFVFNSNNLQLTGTLAGGGAVAPTVTGNLGNNSSFSTNSTTASTYGLSSVTNVAVNQIMILEYIGEYEVTGVTGSGGTATITTTPLFGSPTSIGAGKFTLVEFMPYYFGLTSTGAASGTNVLTFSAIPTGCAAGMFVGLYDNTGNTDAQSLTMYASASYQIQSTTSTTLVLAENLVDGVNSGQGVFCTPPISSAQIWTKAYFAPPGWGKTYLAMDATVELPQNAVPYSSSGTLSGAASNGAYGAWPAFWMYGGSGAGWADASEIDNLEAYNNILRNTADLDINVRYPSVAGGGNFAGSSASSALGPQTASFLYNTTLWSYSAPNYTYNTTTDYGAAYHDLQMYETPTAVYEFIDGQLVKTAPYVWTSSRSPQLALNMAIGSLQNGLAINNLLPIASTNFPMTYNIKELKVWAQ